MVARTRRRATRRSGTIRKRTTTRTRRTTSTRRRTTTPRNRPRSRARPTRQKTITLPGGMKVRVNRGSLNVGGVHIPLKLPGGFSIGR